MLYVWADAQGSVYGYNNKKCFSQNAGGPAVDTYRPLEDTIYSVVVEKSQTF